MLIAVLVLIWWLGKPNGTAPVVSNNPIKVGVILPLTGDIGFLGEEIKKGIDLGLEDIDQGLIEVVYEDDAFDPAKTASAANKLLAINKIDLGATMIVEEARPIVKIFNDQKVPLLVLWDSNKFIQDSGEYVFSNGFSTEQAGEDMATYAYQTLGLRKIAILGHIDPWSEIISQSFLSQFTNLGGQIVQEEYAAVDTLDYRTLLSKTKTLKPDGIYFPMIPPANAIFLKQAKQLGLKSAFLTGDAFIQDSIIEAGEAANGVYFTNHYADESYNLSTRYVGKFKTQPVDISLVAFGYDGVMKIADALQTSNSGVILDGLNQIFGPNRSAERQEKIFKVQNGKPVLVN